MSGGGCDPRKVGTGAGGRAGGRAGGGPVREVSEPINRNQTRTAKVGVN